MEGSKSQKIITVIAIAAGMYAAYRLSKGDTPKKAVAKTIEKPKEAIKTVEETIKPVVKEADKIAKKAKLKRKSVKKSQKKKIKTSNSTLSISSSGTLKQRVYTLKGVAEHEPYIYNVNKKEHKGHATAKGLAQDQKLVTKEKHEVAYQKKKGKK